MPESSTDNLREVNYVIAGDFAGILHSLDSTLLISTYQAGKLIAVCADQERLRFSFHNFERPMGLAVSNDQWAVASKNQIWFLDNAAEIAHQVSAGNPNDACYLTRSSHYTDEIHVHELAWCKGESRDELWVVNTLFSCLCTLHPSHNFVPRWRPPFVTDLAAEDRCHLNGFAIENGRPKFVSVLGTRNEPEGWRESKAIGGCLLDIASGETIASGFAMPHSPRIHHERLWLRDSGRGCFVTVDPITGDSTTVQRLPGFLRGLALRQKYAFIGLSKIRETSSFGDIPIAEQRDELRCGVGIVDHRPGQCLVANTSAENGNDAA